jgi:hypothetical protein
LRDRTRLEFQVLDTLLTFDKASARRIDENGFLHVDETNISKATVNPYYGSEIPNAEALGLDPKKVYKLLRDPEELKKGASTFNNLPILDMHIPISAFDMDKQEVKDHYVGSTGTDAVFDTPYLKNSMVLHAASAIKDVEEKKKQELSCAYRYDPVMTPGTFDGQAYDGIMTNIRGNHVSLVTEGRAGHDVKVMDAALDKRTVDYQKIYDGVATALGLDRVADKIRMALGEAMDDDDDDGNGTGREVAEQAAEKAIKLASTKPTPENRAIAAKLCKEAAQAHVDEGFPKQGAYYSNLAAQFSTAEDSISVKLRAALDGSNEQPSDDDTMIAELRKLAPSCPAPETDVVLEAALVEIMVAKDEVVIEQATPIEKKTAEVALDAYAQHRSDVAKLIKSHEDNVHSLGTIFYKIASRPLPVINVNIAPPPPPIVNVSSPAVSVAVDAKGGTTTKTVTFNRDENGDLVSATTEENS